VIAKQREKNHQNYSMVFGIIFLIFSSVFIWAEIELSKNLVEIAFALGLVESNVWLALPYGIALISVFFKYICDQLSDNENQIKTETIRRYDGRFQEVIDKFLFWLINHPRSILQAVYVLIIVFLLYDTYDLLGVIREKVFPLYIRNLEKTISDNRDVGDITGAERDAVKNEMEQLQIEIKNKINDLLQKKDPDRVKSFYLLTVCFALIGGLFFSLGVRRIYNSIHFQRVRKAWLDIQEKYEEIRPVIGHDPINYDGISEKLIDKYQLIYKHGYFRGVFEKKGALPLFFRNYIRVALTRKRPL